MVNTQDMCVGLLQKLPPEVLIEILSKLSPGSLFRMNHVNKLFYHLGNENALWREMYVTKFGGKMKKKKPAGADEVLTKMATVKLKNCPSGYWKHQFYQTAFAHDSNKMKQYLEPVNPFTGMPLHTQRLLRKLEVTWELTVCGTSGQKNKLELIWYRILDTCVCLCWSGSDHLPDYQHISTLQLHSVKRFAFSLYRSLTVGSPCRSLMAEFDLQRLNESAQIIGHDNLIDLRMLKPGLIVGTWKDQGSIAFIMVTLHFHRLAETIIRASPVSPSVEPLFRPPVNDRDPEYGLHGYTLHIDLCNSVCNLMYGKYHRLHCNKSQIRDGLIKLKVISKRNSSLCNTVSALLTVPWCEALQGSAQLPNSLSSSCCVMSLTLLDQFDNPFWCVSSAVSMVLDEKSSALYNDRREHFLIHYRDADGRVKMKLAWLEEWKQFFVTSLVVYVRLRKVNDHFRRDY